MFDSIINLISPFILYLAAKYGVVGETIGILLFVAGPIASVLIEIVEVIAAVTPSKTDDALAKTARAKYDGIIKALEFLPHVNLPIAPVLLAVFAYAKRTLAAVKGAISGWSSGA